MFLEKYLQVWPLCLNFAADYSKVSCIRKFRNFTVPIKSPHWDSVLGTQSMFYVELTNFNHELPANTFLICESEPKGVSDSARHKKSTCKKSFVVFKLQKGAIGILSRYCQCAG